MLNPLFSVVGAASSVLVEQAETMLMNITVSQVARRERDVIFIIIFRQKHALYEKRGSSREGR